MKMWQCIKLLLAAALGFFAFADANAYSSKISLKTKYLGSIGTTVDDQAVLQPYVEFGDSTGVYGYFWANVPLTEGNPKNSAELEPSVGYRQSTPWFDWSASVTVFDMQSPGLLEYRQDVLSPSIQFSKGNRYVEMRYYGADRADDGFLLAAGYNAASKNVVIRTSLVYVDAPFHFDAIAYAKATFSTDFNGGKWTAALELMDILYFENSEDAREDEFALALSYRF